MLKSSRPSQGAAEAESKRTGTLNSPPYTSEEIDIRPPFAPAVPRLDGSRRMALMADLRNQLHRCWQAPAAAKNVVRPPVPRIRLSLNQDGSLARAPTLINPSSDPLFRSVADTAAHAASRCSPLRVPAEYQPYYQEWKELIVNFDPRDLG
jgi:colicin import membrane protein